MLRVLATMKNSQYSDDFKDEQSDLSNWVLEIQDGMYDRIVSRFMGGVRPVADRLQRSNNLFGNYVDESDSFDDAASTALLASTVYRLSLLSGVHKHLPSAEKSRTTLSSSNSSGLVHFDQDGWLRPVVDPYNVGAAGSKSPEGQAFVVMMQAAYNDWEQDGSKGGGTRLALSLEVLLASIIGGVAWMFF